KVPIIRVEKNRLLTVLVNLIKNSINAIDSSGGPKKDIEIGTAFDANARMVTISVSDTGTGMTEDVMKQLFSFGFSTRKGKGGSGFGLHSSANLAKAMGGDLTAHSEGLGKGARFTIVLPFEPPVGEVEEG
ncbi:MAG: HAMP domain-containing sensor histidine kinase, partial [Candidatus Brocadiia bacterium]